MNSAHQDHSVPTLQHAAVDTEMKCSWAGSNHISRATQISQTVRDECARRFLARLSAPHWSGTPDHLGLCLPKFSRSCVTRLPKNKLILARPGRCARVNCLPAGRTRKGEVFRLMFPVPSTACQKRLSGVESVLIVVPNDREVSDLVLAGFHGMQSLRRT